MWQQTILREFCKEKGILITAYSPLGAKGTPWGKNWVMECEVLKEIAKKKGKTIAQVLIFIFLILTNMHTVYKHKKSLIRSIYMIILFWVFNHNH